MPSRHRPLSADGATAVRNAVPRSARNRTAQASAVSIRALAELVYAAIYGIELRHALAGDDYALDEVLTILEEIMIRAQDEQAPCESRGPAGQ